MNENYLKFLLLLGVFIVPFAAGENNETLMQDCPPHTGECGIDEYFDDNGLDDYCEARCANPTNYGVQCTETSPKCVCLPGYVRVGHTNRKCVKIEQCGDIDRDYSWLNCSSNEVSTDCGTFGFCEGTCANPDSNGVKCPRVCVKTCRCKDGFVRVSETNKTCVPLESCPKDAEKFVGGCLITNAINETCPEDAKCLKGYKLKKEGSGCCCEELVTLVESNKCGANEKLSKIAPAEFCEGRCANPNNTGIACPPPHGSRCVCAPGFIRVCQTNRTCVKVEDCGKKPRDYITTPCLLNEVLNDCGKFDYCDKTCENPQAEGIKCPEACVKRCDCHEGYLRTSFTNKTCILKNSCPKLDTSLAGFCTITDALNKTCPVNATCPNDYQLRREGQGCCCEEFTIPENLTCGRNEVYAFPAPASFCEGRCANPNNIGIDCPPPHGASCICAPGFVRVCQSNRTCVRLQDCGKKPQDYLTSPCPLNEVCNNCSRFDYCDKTCENPNAAGIICPKVCVKRCDCKQGFIRASFANKTCIPLDSCPKVDIRNPGLCTVSNALSDDCPLNATCPEGFQLKCEGRGCCCEEFTIPEKLNCPRNEVIAFPAPAEFCEGRCANPNNTGIACPPPHGARCVCAPGFIRVCQTNRTCVRLEDCGKKPKDYVWSPCASNETFNICSRFDYCDGTCENPKAEGIACPKVCVQRCDCKEGFVRASFINKTCVPLNLCPKLDKKFVGFCTITDALNNTCPENPECPPDYQLRREGEGCCCEEFTIPEKLTCGQNEVFAFPAPASFCEGRCANPNNIGIDCPPPHGASCICAPGFIRVCQTNRTCVRLQDCGKKPRDYISSPCPLNEVYNYCSTFDYCDKTCDNPNADGIFCPKVCVERCDCKEGFIRASFINKTCVPLDSCPKSNKMYVGFCTITDTLNKTCPINPECPKDYQLRREGEGCCCEEFTIPERLVCPRNEVIAFPAPAEFCEGRCANPNNTAIACPPPHGARCVCAPGFIRVCQTNRTCVRLEDCGKKPRDYLFKPNPCSQDEVYNKCGKFDYCDETCDNPNATKILCPKACVERCDCKEGLVRASFTNKTCVRLEACPKPDKTIAKMCSIGAGYKKSCPMYPTCPDGYQLRDDGCDCCCEEIATPEIIECKENEYFAFPVPADFCESTCGNPSLSGITCPPLHGPGCLCAPGFVRQSFTDRTCVKQENCGKIEGDDLKSCSKNEVPTECGKYDFCDETCESPNSGGVNCVKTCVPRCRCKDGFVRVSRLDKKCIPRELCSVSDILDTELSIAENDA